MIALEAPRELASIKWIHIFMPRFSYYNEKSTKTVTFLQSNVMSSYFEPVTEDGSSQFLNQQVQGHCEEIPTKAFCGDRKILGTTIGDQRNSILKAKEQSWFLYSQFLLRTKHVTNNNRQSLSMLQIFPLFMTKFWRKDKYGWTIYIWDAANNTEEFTVLPFYQVQLKKISFRQTDKLYGSKR